MPLALLAIVLSLTAWSATLWQDGQPEYDRELDRKAHAAKADRVYPAIERAPISTFDRAQDLADALRPTLLAYAKEAGATIDDASLHTLIDQAAGMLWHRFAQADPTAYTQWRLDNGYRWLTESEMQSAFIVSDWPYWFGEEPWPGYDKIDEAWAKFWNRQTDDGDALVVTSWSIGNPGCAIATMEVTPESIEFYPLFRETDDMAWALAHTGGFRSWFVGPVPGVRDMLERDGKLTTARIGILCEWNDGKIRPLYLLYVRDTDGRWWLQGVSVTTLSDWTRPIPEF